MISFLTINGIHLNYTDDDLIEIGLSLAAGIMNYDDLVSWIKKHSN